jgi:hypothetical protein
MKFRHETKHIITYSDYLSVRSRLKLLAKCDQNVGPSGKYRIRSLYFDNYNDKALREKIDGVNQREKFRIRYYNEDTSFIRLERKSKYNGLSNKIAASITKEEVNRILDGDYEFLKESKQALLIDLYTKMQNQLLRPKVIVEYEREPFVYTIGNVRITFDMNIKTGLYSKEFFRQDIPLLNAQENNLIVMEVKYDEFIPEIIKLCIQVNERQNSAMSKYAICRRFG